MGQRLDMHETICNKIMELGRYLWDPFNFETDNADVLTREMVRERVYYQPAASVKLKYPCVVYKLEDMPPIHANNTPYHWNHVYQVTVIDRDPESAFREKIAELSTCRFSRAFVADNLYHFVFRVYN